MTSKILLVGAGGMSQSYFDVLNSKKLDFDVVCRSEKSAASFEEIKGKKPYFGGVSSYLVRQGVPSYAIVAVGVQHLSSITNLLLQAGVRQILMEKPAALHFDEINSVNSLAQKFNANVYVAYNRRFYSSVERLIDMSSQDGGITSISFDFTEWADRIAPLEKDEGVKERWILANSTHVIDLAFFLAGKPVNISSYNSGSLDWHNSSARFTGSGITVNNILFDYRADWDAPGRWGLTAYTKNYKLELLPLERLSVTERNTVVASNVELEDNLDRDFKPGLVKQVIAFLNNDDRSLCSVSEQLDHFPAFLQIAGYKS
jgi:predicted dehydrogenase